MDCELLVIDLAIPNLARISQPDGSCAVINDSRYLNVSTTASSVLPIFTLPPPLTLITFVFSLLIFKPNSALYSSTNFALTWSSTSDFANRVVSSAYLMFQMLSPATRQPIYSPASSFTSLMIFSPTTLNTIGDRRQPWRTPFSKANTSVFPLSTALYPRPSCLTVLPTIRDVSAHQFLTTLPTAY